MAVATTELRAAPSRRVLRALAGAALLYLVLAQPNHPQALTWGALAVFPLEWPAILLGLSALPGRARALRCALVAVLLALVLVKLADFAMFAAFNRGFNPLVDLHLVDAGWRLGSAAAGLGLAVAAAAGVGVALVALAWALWRATGAWVGLARGGWRLAAVAGALLAAGVAAAEVGQAMRAWRLPVQPPGAAFTARVAAERVVQWNRTLGELATFRRAAASDPFAGRAGLLSALKGREVLVVFVESYGRASIDNPLYAPSHLATLREGEARLAAVGLAMRSGWLASPIEGGQSWLAHATLASGLGVAGQSEHGALLASGRPTLYQMAQAEGWRTAAVMPAITMPWPEHARLGFEVLLDRDAMGYEGPAFNWITMPDQFTLARFRDRLSPDPRPLFAQIALISSHAPWVPVPTPVPWEAVGDGTVFAPMVRGVDPPEVVWRDRDRVRDQYRQAIDYALRVSLDFAARQDGPLIVLLGDHPAAAFVSQVGNRDVPLHLIGPPEVLAAVEGWGFAPGLVPDAASPVWPMEAFRDRFLAAFSEGAP